MMLLQDSLDEAVADVSADLPTLAAASRRRGLSLRRRFRALASVGATAAVTVLAFGGAALLRGPDAPDGADYTVGTDAAAPVITGPLSGETGPITWRGAAAALAATVGEEAHGTIGRLQGDVADHEALAALLLQPDAASGPAGQVMINLQPLGMAGKPPYRCDAVYMLDCSVLHLPNGDTVRTYRDDDDEMGAGSQRLAVEVVSPSRRLRIVLSALNTNPWADGAHRAAPVLDREQATAVATAPWWSRTQLPREYLEAGEQLGDYVDADIDEN